MTTRTKDTARVRMALLVTKRVPVLTARAATAPPLANGETGEASC